MAAVPDAERRSFQVQFLKNSFSDRLLKKVQIQGATPQPE